jgi:ATP-dependent Zn protease
VSLRASGQDGGFTDAGTIRSSYLRETDLLQHLMIMLAGRAAEEEVLGVASSGAGGQYGSDLERATRLAVTADTAFGFTEGGGLVWRGMPDALGLPGILATNAAMAGRVRVRLDDAYVATRQLIRERVAAVRDLASVLVDRRVVDGAEAEGIIRRNLCDGGRT